MERTIYGRRAGMSPASAAAILRAANAVATGRIVALPSPPRAVAPAKPARIR